MGLHIAILKLYTMKKNFPSRQFASVFSWRHMEAPKRVKITIIREDKIITDIAVPSYLLSWMVKVVT